MPQILIAAAHKSSGKTTLSIGLCAALNQQGLAIQAFKKGPDYIDPLWLAAASQKPCYNLDFYTMSAAEIQRQVYRHGQNADLCLIEANKGLHDGLDLEGKDSNAALAALLDAPVILVLDSRGTTRGVAPLLLGYQAFDPRLNIAGVIFNQVGGVRHAAKLRAVTEHYTDIPVLGMVAKNPDLQIEERHLGLMPSNEKHEAQKIINKIASAVREQVDLAQFQQLAAELKPIAYPAFSQHSPHLRIGILKDAAFGFYYADDLAALERAGAELVFIDALNDAVLPDIAGLFIGGGFPETQAEQLAKNVSLRTDIKTKIEQNLPVYAECGGLMYLGRQIHYQGNNFPMCGALPFDTVMGKRPQGRGYIRLQIQADNCWLGKQQTEIAAHEFHYSRIENLQPDLNFAYKVLRGHGIDGKHDGILYKNTLACYTHLHHVDKHPWTQHFVDFCLQYR